MIIDLEQDKYENSRRESFLTSIYQHESNFSEFYGTPINIAEAVRRDLDDRYTQVVFDGVKFYKYNGKFFDELTLQELKMWIAQYDAKEFMRKEGKTANTYQVIKIGQTVSEPKIIDHLQNICFDPDFFNLDTRVFGFNCDNGFINCTNFYEDFIYQEHSPEQRQTNCLPVEFCVWTSKIEKDAVPKESLLYKFLLGCFKNHEKELPNIIHLFSELLAATLFEYGTQIKEPKAFILIGETARNGKSQFIKIIKSLLNPANIAHVAVDHFNDPFDIINLKEKALNYSDELGAREGIDSARFKSIISGEAITARALYKDFTTFYPRALHIFATNKMPSFRGGFDKGNQRRLKIINFDRRIPDSEIIENIAEKIIEKEMDKLALLAAQGMTRLLRFDRYTTVSAFEEKLDDYATSDDAFLGWLREAVIFSTDHEVPTRNLYTHYSNWYDISGHNPKGKLYINKLSERLKGVENIKHKHTNKGNFFIGLQPKVLT